MPLAVIDIPDGLEGHGVYLIAADPRDAVSTQALVLAAGTPEAIVSHLLDQCSPEWLGELKLVPILRAQQRAKRRLAQLAADAAAACDRDEPDLPPVEADAFEAAHASVAEDDGEAD